MKKILAATLALMMTATVLASCDEESSSKAEESKAEELSSVAEESVAESTAESAAADENTPVDIKEMPTYLKNQETASLKFTTDMNVEDICTPLLDSGASNVTLTIEELEGIPMLRVQVLDKDDQGLYMLPKLQFNVANLFKGKESELPKVFTIKADIVTKAVGPYHSEETGDDLMVPGNFMGKLVTQPHDDKEGNTWNELIEFAEAEWVSDWGYYELMCRPGIKEQAKYLDTTESQFFTLMRWGIPNQADFYFANLTFLDEAGNVIECSYGK
ncbi:MAG: hypothetical protein Q4D35_06520 [Ruminococcus sp.]|nr:hypothetical protein [Ruminococcus sp.]